MKTTRERAQERRDAKLEQVQEQVANGSLVIRQMTAEERKRYGLPAPKQAAPGSAQSV